VPISFASFIACFLNSSSYCFPVPIDDTLLCFYYTLIVLYVSSFIIQDYLGFTRFEALFLPASVKVGL
jgi:hypothetical protein